MENSDSRDGSTVFGKLVDDIDKLKLSCSFLQYVICLRGAGKMNQ